MRKLQNTLYVTTPSAYLSLDGENIVVYWGSNEKAKKGLLNRRKAEQKLFLTK